MAGGGPADGVWGVPPTGGWPAGDGCGAATGGCGAIPGTMPGGAAAGGDSGATIELRVGMGADGRPVSTGRALTRLSRPSRRQYGQRVQDGSSGPWVGQIIADVMPVDAGDASALGPVAADPADASRS